MSQTVVSVTDEGEWPCWSGTCGPRKPTGPQTTDLQRDALLAAGVAPDALYEDSASGKKDDRPSWPRASRRCARDTLVVWKLDRLGRDLRHLVNIVHELTQRGVGLKVLIGQGAAIDTPLREFPRFRPTGSCLS